VIGVFLGAIPSLPSCAASVALEWLHLERRSSRSHARLSTRSWKSANTQCATQHAMQKCSVSYQHMVWLGLPTLEEGRRIGYWPVLRHLESAAPVDAVYLINRLAVDCCSSLCSQHKQASRSNASTTLERALSVAYFVHTGSREFSQARPAMQEVCHSKCCYPGLCSQPNQAKPSQTKPRQDKPKQTS
jgi:hypothetical protein